MSPCKSNLNRLTPPLRLTFKRQSSREAAATRKWVEDLRNAIRYSRSAKGDYGFSVCSIFHFARLRGTCVRAFVGFWDHSLTHSLSHPSSYLC